MKSKSFKIFLFFGIVFVGLLMYAIIQYNKPHVDIKNSQAEITINVEQLISQFKNDETLATQKYTDKVIQIEGILNNISISEGNSVISLKYKNEETSVICYMQPENSLNLLKLKKGEQIKIKGVCTGFLLDIIMVRCLIVKDN